MSGIEKAIEKNCIEYLRMRGFYCQKIHSGALMVAAGPARYRVNLADRGTPDIFACVRGRLVCIEVKESPEEAAEWERQWQKHVETKQLKKSWERSIYQHVEQDKWRGAGAEIIVVSSVEELDRDINILLEEFSRNS